MKKKLYSLFILFLVSYCSFSQGIGIGTTTPDPSAALDITATNKGLLIPRMSLASINAIINPARGLMAYDSVANQLMANIGTPAAHNWQPVALLGNNVWSLNGNSGTIPANHFIGTTDNQILRFRINNIRAGELNPANGNIFWGLRAGQSTTGFSNIAIGTDALRFNTDKSNLVAIGDSALFHNNQGGSFDDGIFNTAIGSKSLFLNTSGSRNTATGFNSLFSNSTGADNTAMGFRSLFANTAGVDNTAFGFQSLSSNTTGNNNTAVGSFSLFINTTGINNTAIGLGSLFTNTSGFNNTGSGFQALNSNLTGSNNSALGTQALLSNTTGTLNTAIGAGAQILNTTGSFNTAVGFNALRNNLIGNENTAIGRDALFVNTGNFNVAIGSESMKSTTFSEQNTVVGFGAGSAFALGFNNTLIGANADMFSADLFNCVAIGNNARCGSSNQIRFGNSFTTSIGGVVGFTNLSDGRYKKNIQESVKGIDFIMKLRPVTYQLDISGLSKKLNENNGKEMDDHSKKSMAEQEKTIFSGFVAQEVEQAAKDVRYDFSGVDKPKNENDMYGLRYSEFVVPLVKAVQEQQQMINEQRQMIHEQEQIIKTQQQIMQKLKMQDADLQKRVLALEKK